MLSDTGAGRAAAALDIRLLVSRQCCPTRCRRIRTNSGQAAGVREIGYANRPAKVETFQAVGAEVVIADMSEIASALIEHIDCQLCCDGSYL